jgi:outer membrane protein assembly factor BamD (BamD/ComL family)
MRTKRLATAELCLLLILTACTKHTAVVAARPRTPIPPAPPASIVALDEADRAFTAKEYDDASRDYEDYIRLTPPQDQQDQALFRLGMAYTLKKTGPDWPRAQAVWKRLIAEYPNSTLKPQVELILTLYSEVGQANADMKARDDRIKQLSTELDRLKKIDSERRKTP